MNNSFRIGRICFDKNLRKKMAKERNKETNKQKNKQTNKHWINELVSYCTPEKILYNVRRKHVAFRKIWGPFIDILPSLYLTHHVSMGPPGPDSN